MMTKDRMMTKERMQEFYDRAKAGVVGQGRKSWDESEALCLYRGPEGTRCAFGWNVPDEVYDPKMEGAVAEFGVDTDRLSPAPLATAARAMDRVFVALGLKKEDSTFLRDLQRAHDDSRAGEGFVENFLKNMRNVAQRYDLVP